MAYFVTTDTPIRCYVLWYNIKMDVT